MGLLNNAIPSSLFVWGQSHITSGLAAILNATTPLFTVLVAHVLTKDEKLTIGRLSGVVIGLVGVAVMIGSDVFHSLSINIAAQAACLAGALSYAFSGVFGRRFSAMRLSPTEVAAGQLTASGLLLLPLTLVIDRPWTLPLPSAAAIAALIGIAVLSTAIGYILYFRILATAGATNLLLVTFLIPVSAILLSATALGEAPLPQHVAGMAFIGFGLAAIEGRLWRLTSDP